MHACQMLVKCLHDCTILYTHHDPSQDNNFDNLDTTQEPAFNNILFKIHFGDHAGVKLGQRLGQSSDLRIGLLQRTKTESTWTYTHFFHHRNSTPNMFTRPWCIQTQCDWFYIGSPWFPILLPRFSDHSVNVHLSISGSSAICRQVGNSGHESVARPGTSAGHTKTSIQNVNWASNFHKTIYPMLFFSRCLRIGGVDMCGRTKKYSESPKMFKFKFGSEHFSELRSVARDCARVARNCARVALSKITTNLPNFSIFNFLYVLYTNPQK